MMYDLSELKLFEPITNSTINDMDKSVYDLRDQNYLVIIENEDGTSFEKRIENVYEFDNYLDSNYQISEVVSSNMSDGISNINNDINIVLLKSDDTKEYINIKDISLYLRDNITLVIDSGDISSIDNNKIINDVENNLFDRANSVNNENIDMDEINGNDEDDIETIDIFDDEFKLESIVPTDISLDIDFNRSDNYCEDFIDVGKLDFSKITVVLGKTDRVVSSSIVDRAQKKLEDFNIKVYISDIDKIIGEVYEQASKDNPYDDILGIRIGGENGEKKYPVIIENKADAKYPNNGSRNSSSLALALHKTLSRRNDVLVVSGKRNSYLEEGVRIETEFEKKVDNLNLQNPGIKNVTVLFDDIQNYDDIVNNIVEGVIYYVSFDREARDRAYFSLASDPSVKVGSLKFGSDDLANFSSDTVLILPFPKELNMDLKY